MNMGLESLLGFDSTLCSLGFDPDLALSQIMFFNSNWEFNTWMRVRSPWVWLSIFAKSIQVSGNLSMRLAIWNISSRVDPLVLSCYTRFSNSWICSFISFESIILNLLKSDVLHLFIPLLSRPYFFSRVSQRILGLVME